jgi:2-polyprenyl-3-methyl-5-hydroxy-6-metoxy-1,4-benzoquinol methylase
MSGDVRERLEPADLESGGLLAASHLHRYEFVARFCAGRRVLDLCCGTGYGARILARTAASVHGVDVSAEAIATALGEHGGGETGLVTFEREDAVAYLRAVPAGRFDVIVCFEGLEHIAEPAAAIEELARLAESDTELILSLPNSRGFDERNEFHVTDYGYEEMREVSERFRDAIVISQYLAEASLCVRANSAPASEVRGRLVDGRTEEAWANHWLILVGVEEAEVNGAEALLALAVAAHHNDYMRGLERANRELYRTNQRLARGHLGVHDAAAGSAEARRRRLEAQVGELTRELEEERTARLRHEAALTAPRYRAVDALRTLAFTVPGLGTLLRLRSRLVQRRAGSRAVDRG